MRAQHRYPTRQAAKAAAARTAQRARHTTARHLFKTRTQALRSVPAPTWEGVLFTVVREEDRRRADRETPPGQLPGTA